MALAANPNHELLEVGPVQILPDEHLVRAGDRALLLSIRELRLITALARSTSMSASCGSSSRRRSRGGASSTPISASGTGWRSSQSQLATTRSQPVNTLPPPGADTDLTTDE